MKKNQISIKELNFFLGRLMDLKKDESIWCVLEMAEFHPKVCVAAFHKLTSPELIKDLLEKIKDFTKKEGEETSSIYIHSTKLIPGVNMAWLFS